MEFVELLLTKRRHHQHSQESSFLQPVLGRDFISLLSERGLDHVAENIFSYLDAKSLCAAELVCREWYQVISEGMLWKKLIERRVRTDSSWRGLMEQRGWIKYLFKPSPGEPHPHRMVYRRIYPIIIQDIENIENNWRCGRPTQRRINCQSGGVCCVQYDDRKIVSGLIDNTIKVWDRNTLECIQVLTGHTGPVADLKYDDRVIISLSDDSTVRIWDVKTGELIKTFISHEDVFDEIYSQRLVVNGRRVDLRPIEKYELGPSRDGAIPVLNSATRELVRTLEGHKQDVTCLQYSGRLVVSGSMDKTIRLWDVESGACLRTLEGHKDSVTCIQFDKKRIVSGANDGEIKVWDLAAALDPLAPARTLCLRTLVGHYGSVFSLQFDDFQIVSGSSDDTILIWDFLNATPPETPAINICITYIKNVFNSLFSFVPQQIH